MASISLNISPKPPGNPFAFSICFSNKNSAASVAETISSSIPRISSYILEYFDNSADVGAGKPLAAKAFDIFSALSAPSALNTSSNEIPLVVDVNKALDSSTPF